MGLPKIEINKGSSGLGRPLAGRDHVSAFLFYTDTLPAGFTATDRIKKFFSIEEVEATGIIEGHATFGIYWYHINEYFRLQPKGELFVGLYGVPVGTYDFEEVTTIQDFAEGDIRQIAVYTPDQTFATTQVSTLQGVLTDNEDAFQPLQALYAADISGTTDLTTLPDLKTLNSKNVTVVIGQDGNAAGKDLFDTQGTSVTHIGAALGAVSLANVNESIAWVSKFLMSNGVELDVAAFANGDLVRETSVGLQDSLRDNGYLGLRKFKGRDGSYNTDSLTSISETSDFSTIENNRTIDKAIRDVRVNVLPALSGPVQVNADGQLSEDYITYLRSLALFPLDNMLSNDEISARQVIINPEQDVLSTSLVEMTIEIVPIGVARTIKINIGFTTQIS